VAEAVGDGERVAPAVPVTVGAGEALPLARAVGEGGAVGVPVGEAAGEGLRGPVPVAEADTVAVTLTVALPVAAAERESWDAVAAAEPLAVRLARAVAEAQPE
jgi:hypothetical protein